MVVAVVTVGIIVVVRVMAHPLAIALSVAVLVTGLVTALTLAAAVLGDSLPSSVVAVAGEIAFLDQTGLATVTWMIAMMVAVMVGTVSLLTAETDMMGAVIVMPVTGTLLVVTALVQTGMELLRTVMHQVVVEAAMAGSGREATREMDFVVVAAPMTGVARGAVQATTGTAQGAASAVAMTGTVHVEAAPTMAAEGLLATREEVTGRGLRRTTAPGEEDASTTATSDRPVAAVELCTCVFNSFQFGMAECLMSTLSARLSLFCTANVTPWAVVEFTQQTVCVLR